MQQPEASNNRYAGTDVPKCLVQPRYRHARSRTMECGGQKAVKELVLKKLLILLIESYSLDICHKQILFIK